MQLGIFAMIAGALLVLNVTQTWLNQMIKLKLREGLVARSDRPVDGAAPAPSASPMPARSASIRTSACTRMPAI